MTLQLLGIFTYSRTAIDIDSILDKSKIADSTAKDAAKAEESDI